MRFITIVLLLVFGITAGAAAQKQGKAKIDSLQQLVLKSADDTNKVILFNSIAYESTTINPDEGIEYAKKAFELAKKLNYRQGEAESFSNQGLNLTSKADYSGALENHFKALAIHESMNSQKRIAVCYSNIGVVYNNQMNLEKAREYYEKALEQFRELKFEQGVATTLGNLGLVYHATGEHEKALSSFSESLHYSESKNDTTSMAICIGNMGNSYLAQNRLDKALEYDLRALALNEQIGDIVGSGIGMGNVGEVYFKIATDTNTFLLDSLFKGNKQKAIDLAISYLKRSLEIFKTIGFLNGIQEIHKYLASIYESVGDYKNALAEAREHMQMKDSVFNVDNNNRIAAIETKRLNDLNQKELEIKNLRIQKAEKEQWLLIGAIFFLLIISIISYNRFRIKQQSNRQLEKTLNHLKSTQAQLVEQEKLASLGALAAGVAHEIQNPLNFVNNFSELGTELIDDLATEDDEEARKQLLSDLKENLGKINQHGKRADAIVKNMLMHSRTESGTRQLTDINKLCEEALGFSFHATQAKYKGFSCDIEKHFSTNLEELSVVPGDISRVVLNMMNNAFYSMYQKKLNSTDSNYKPKLTLSTFRGPDRTLITITDNGLGIPADVQQKLFEPFFTTKPANEGTGLGLSISYDIIKAHGGKITVKSDGNETAFVIELRIT